MLSQKPISTQAQLVSYPGMKYYKVMAGLAKNIKMKQTVVTCNMDEEDTFRRLSRTTYRELIDHLNTCARLTRFRDDTISFNKLWLEEMKNCGWTYQEYLNHLNEIIPS